MGVPLEKRAVEVMALSRGLVLLGVLLVAGTAAALTAEETATEERETMRRSLVEEMRASHPVRGSNRDEDPLEQASLRGSCIACSP